ncbi:alpha/beta hydrolase [bacterium]|nr:alpha/beta hydrolase [bacterium]MDB4731626.1 alpha/beta hydrolase [bacterium]
MEISILQGVCRGLSSFVGMLLFPIGWWWCRSIDSFATPDRLDRGCVFVLSGIQGKSPIEFGVARGLNDAGVRSGIVIFEWTTGLWPLFLFHLRAKFWHRRMAKKLANAIVEYQSKYPGRPVFLLGHSGGAGLSLMAANELPDGNKLSGIILLGPAVSPIFPLDSALTKTEQGIWNFHSILDCLFLGIGTILAGTMDGKHRPSAGMVCFKGTSIKDKSEPQLHQLGYSFKMISQWHFGGHFGYSNRVFIANEVAPLIEMHHIE